MNDFRNPALLAMDIVRYIGDRVSESGEPIPRLRNLGEAIGAPSHELVEHVFEDLEDENVIRVDSTVFLGDGRTPLFFRGVDLTLEGWERYEAEKRGKLGANYGFIAMKFGDPALDPFVKDTVKPAVKEIGYDLVDMRDVARAGIIDDIMRDRIRDSAFVIADLTHDNHGAYWEAGYAEGLGKPVVYICEKTKFDKESTHFDANHCTTVLWSTDDPGGFRRELIATLRRSLPPT